MVAKPSKVYTKLQGNVHKMNVRLSFQYSHEHLKVSNVHGKIGKKALNSFCQHFLVHLFPSHSCDSKYRFAHTSYYQIIFDAFFYVHGNIWPKFSIQFPQQRKVPHTWTFIIENSQQYLFKTKDRLLQKVVINTFLEHDGMRVLSSALFSTCILILIHDDNLFLTEICTITEKPVFYEDKSIFLWANREKFRCTWIFCV